MCHPRNNWGTPAHIARQGLATALQTPGLGGVRELRREPTVLSVQQLSAPTDLVGKCSSQRDLQEKDTEDLNITHLPLCSVKG